jgi:hypothetical protein
MLVTATEVNTDSSIPASYFIPAAATCNGEHSKALH